MSNKVKIQCGGFYLGDGLTMDGNTLKSSGGEQVQSDWNQNDTTAVNYIKNKPVFVVTATLSEQVDNGNYENSFENGVDSPLQFDKTFDEITAAYNKSNVIFCNLKFTDTYGESFQKTLSLRSFYVEDGSAESEFVLEYQDGRHNKSFRVLYSTDYSEVGILDEVIKENPEVHFATMEITGTDSSGNQTGTITTDIIDFYTARGGFLYWADDTNGTSNRIYRSAFYVGRNMDATWYRFVSYDADSNSLYVITATATGVATITKKSLAQ